MKLKNVKVGLRVVVKEGVDTNWYTSGNVGTVLWFCKDGTVSVDFDSPKNKRRNWWVVKPKEIKPIKRTTDIHLLQGS